MLARLRQGDAGALPAAAALDLATRGAGRALGRPDLGVLAPGAKADMMAVSLDDPAFVPLLDDAMLIEHLVWSASSRLVDRRLGGRRAGGGRPAAPHRSTSSGPGTRSVDGPPGWWPVGAADARPARLGETVGVGGQVVGEALHHAGSTLARTRPVPGHLRVVGAGPLDAGPVAVGGQGDIGPVVAHREAAQDPVGEVAGRVPGQRPPRGSRRRSG